MVQKSDDLKKTQIRNIKISGFKSIKTCDVEFGKVNVLIGPNGSGKSNFISVFKMIKEIYQSQIQQYISRQGGPDTILYNGRRMTQKLIVDVYFGDNGYAFTLEPTNDNRMMFIDESFYWDKTRYKSIGSGHFETKSFEGTHTYIDNYVRKALRNWDIYHFHDTGDFSPIKKQSQLNDNMFLRSNGENLAAFLYLLKNKYEKHYYRIVQTIKLVAPFFGDFILRENPLSPNYIALEWHEKNNDIPFIANMLSDGTLRFICLATALLQPEELQPDTIFIDEPELGLHPYAITILAALVRKASIKKQVIISTQSVELLNEFDIEDIIVVDRENEQTTFKRLNYKELETWLEDYSLGEIWKKNIIGGRP